MNNIRTQTFRDVRILETTLDSKAESTEIDWIRNIIYTILRKVLNEENTSKNLIADDNNVNNQNVLFTKVLLERQESKISLLTKLLASVRNFKDVGIKKGWLGYVGTCT